MDVRTVRELASSCFHATETPFCSDFSRFSHKDWKRTKLSLATRQESTKSFAKWLFDRVTEGWLLTRVMCVSSVKWVPGWHRVSGESFICWKKSASAKIAQPTFLTRSSCLQCRRSNNSRAKNQDMSREARAARRQRAVSARIKLLGKLDFNKI